MNDAAKSPRVNPPISAPKPRKVEPDEIPLTPIAHQEKGGITLKCRTPAEAFLVCDLLEESDILTILPEADELQAQYERDYYVEIRVRAY